MNDARAGETLGKMRVPILCSNFVFFFTCYQRRLGVLRSPHVPLTTDPFLSLSVL